MRSPALLLYIAILLPIALAACSSKVSDKDFVHSAKERPKTKSQRIEGVKFTAPDPDYADARELKLKVRELGDQLVADMRDCSLQGLVALPTSFVNLNNFNETSAFGRLIGEQLFYELNQRGYPVREYRMSGNIQPKEKAGEFALSRELGAISTKSGGAVLIAGTYAQAANAVFVNARLIRPQDGRVIRTANLVIESNPTILAMLGARSKKGASGKKGTGMSFADGTMRIRDFDTAMHPPLPKEKLTAIDRGEDIH